MLDEGTHVRASRPPLARSLTEQLTAGAVTVKSRDQREMFDVLMKEVSLVVLELPQERLQNP